MGLADERIFVLHDGRCMGYAEYGDLSGKPLFYFHGFPGSRLEARLIAKAAEKLHIRIIAPDRPGIGLSDFKEGRKILDWPDDVAELADELALEQFAVLGVSGGGPYALACAKKIPRRRLLAAGVVCGLGPLAEPDAPCGRMYLLRYARLFPLLTELGIKVSYGVAAWFFRNYPQKAFWLLSALTSRPDKAFLTRPEIREVFLHSLQEAVRQGPHGGIHELLLYGSPWGFALEDVAVKIHLWHGERDLTVPACLGRYQASRLPNCCAEFSTLEGHFSLPICHMDEILAELIPET